MSKSDWSSLAGRDDVVLPPDRDVAGDRYRAEVAGLLFRLSQPPRPGRVLGVPSGRADGDEPAALDGTAEAATKEDPVAAEEAGGDDVAPVVTSLADYEPRPV